jgi:CBS domain-containing protein
MFAGVLYFIITRQWIISLLITGLGWIIQLAAGYTRRQVKTHMVLQNIKAQDIMTRDYPVMSGQVNVRQLVREHILINGWHYVLVVDEGKLKGLLTVKQIKPVPPKRREIVTIGDIMTPSNQVRIARLQQTADTLYEEMNRWNIDCMPVVEEDIISGVVTRAALMDLVKTRAIFGA